MALSTGTHGLRELALFAGAGGGLLATTHFLGWRTVCAVEADPYRREVLLRRQRDRVLDLFPIWDDVRTFDGRPFRGRVDVVTAGFPCQPFSTAGRRRAAADQRNLWPETIRVVREVRPRFVFLENVPGLLSARQAVRLLVVEPVRQPSLYDAGGGEPGAGLVLRRFVPARFPSYFGDVLRDLAEAGYDAEWTVLGARDVGAPHRRDRLWILAHADRPGELESDRPEREGGGRPGDGGASVADAGAPRRQDDQGCQEIAKIEGDGPACCCRWWDRDPADAGWGQAEPRVGRVVDGVADGLDRLAALGDGQVPRVAAAAFLELIGRLRLR